MMGNGKSSWIRRVAASVAFVFAFGFMVSCIPAALADDGSDARQIMQKAEMTFDDFLNAKELMGFRNVLSKAKGVLISPQVLEGAFVFGVSGGSGAFVVQDSKTGNWNGPAFYTIGEVSFGLQIGGKSSQVIMLAMTERGVNALLSPSVKLGADIGVAAGPVGVGAAAATANISADILVYALSEGLFAGVSLTGAVVAVRNGWNEAYYDKPGVTPTDILIRGEVRNPAARNLLEAVGRATAEPKIAETGKKMEPAQSGENYYTVKAGDTLSEIASEHDTSVDQIITLNDLDAKKHIYPGQRLLLPPGK